MNVIIFGANGGIGRYAVKHSLEAGHNVTAYIRNTNNIQFDNRVKIIRGEINDYQTIKNSLLEQDAVIWCVGLPMKKRYEKMQSLEGHKYLLKAMKEVGVNRLIDWGTPSIQFEKDKKSFITIFPGFIASILFTQARKEMIEIGKIVKSSELNWTLVRFIAPQNSEYKGKVKVSFGDEKIKFSISREDIAAFMVNQIESEKYSYSMPIIGS